MQCQLLAWLPKSMLDHALAEPFADWICRTWQQIITEQRFRLRQPATTVPTIERAIGDRTTHGRAKAASVLLAADDAIGFRLSVDFRKILIEMAKAAS